MLFLLYTSSSSFFFSFLLKVDKLEEAESRRMEETDHQEHKPMIMRKYILTYSSYLNTSYVL